MSQAPQSIVLTGKYGVQVLGQVQSRVVESQVVRSDLRKKRGSVV